jgi:hypothetical protein
MRFWESLRRDKIKEADGENNNLPQSRFLVDYEGLAAT